VKWILSHVGKYFVDVTHHVVYIQAECEVRNDTIVAFILFVAMMMSAVALWREERLLSFIVRAPKRCTISILT
jgi:hypothetical protein